LRGTGGARLCQNHAFQWLRPVRRYHGQRPEGAFEGQAIRRWSRPSGCHMEEYEAPQKVTGRHGSAKSRVPEQNQVSMTADIGLQKKSIREARKIQAAENGSSVGSTLAHVNSSGHEDEQGVHFPMMNGNVSVRVLVTRAALRAKAVCPWRAFIWGASKPPGLFSRSSQGRNSTQTVRPRK